jgi:uncharacterized membrane protein YphA (DoxX/SURF4 family)
LLFELSWGGILIYAGLYKIINPAALLKTLQSFDFLSNSLINLITLILPWVQVILGALLILGYLAKYIASLISMLLLIFIIMNNLAGPSCQTCGFLSELVFYKHGNPFILLTINYLLLGLSVTIVIGRLFSSDRARLTFSQHVVVPLLAFFVGFIVLTFLTYLGRRSYEAKYLSAASGERIRIVGELSQPTNLSLIGANIRTISNIEFPVDPGIELIVMLTVHSLDCGDCAAEAAYLEYLNARYGKRIFFCAVVRRVGKTAIGNFKSRYSITYPFIEDPGLLDSGAFSQFKSLIATLTRDGEVLRIDPIGFNIKEYQSQYESILLSYLR